MLHYGIGALLIILIITITLSYYYNKEGFENITTSPSIAVPSIISPTNTSPISSLALGNTQYVDTIPTPQGKSIEVIPSQQGKIVNLNPQANLSTLNKGLSTQDIKDKNTDNTLTLKDKLIVKAEFRDDKLRIFASMGSLPDTAELPFWLLGKNPNNPDNAPPVIIWRFVFVTNDPGNEAAAIPPDNFKPFVGQTVYLVPKSITNIDDAYATFIIPQLDNTLPPVVPSPTVINPKVDISDTGCTAMQLNKQSNLLNDIQKIIHNEMLANRTLDITVKNTGKNTENKSDTQCNSSPDPSAPDMSQYIRKDQIPCWGCSLDY